MNGLSGVAPRAWLGNYRVFTIPTPAATTRRDARDRGGIEAAVADGMNVINLSGGGPQTEPAQRRDDRAIQNVISAGVVPAIAAGNDRDDFGAGTVSSPGSAPDAITVAAVSTPLLRPGADRRCCPRSARQLPRPPDVGRRARLGRPPQTLVDVGEPHRADGKPVDRHLCGPPGPEPAQGDAEAGERSPARSRSSSAAPAPSSSRPTARRRRRDRE